MSIHTTPSLAVSTIHPSSVNNSVAISVLISLSSTNKIRTPFRQFLLHRLLFFFTRESSSDAFRQGIVTVNVEPSPCLLSTSIVPSMSSTSFFVMPIPMPLPSIRLDVVLRSLSKVSKIRFWNSSDIPIPLSVMVMIILHQSSFSQDFCTTLQDIIPPVFVYFIALLIILRQTSDRCGASIYTYGYMICSVRERV